MQRATTPPYVGDAKEEMSPPNIAPSSSNTNTTSHPHAQHSGPTNDWRSLVATSLTKRRQSPAQQRATVERLLKRTVAPLPIKLPAVPGAVAERQRQRMASTPTSLRKAMREEFVESKEQVIGAQHLNATALLAEAIARAEEAEETGGHERAEGKRAKAENTTSSAGVERQQPYRLHRRRRRKQRTMAILILRLSPPTPRTDFTRLHFQTYHHRLLQPTLSLSPPTANCLCQYCSRRWWSFVYYSADRPVSIVSTDQFKARTAAIRVV